MNQQLELRIDVRSLVNADGFELSDWLKSNEPGAEISYYMLIQESAHGHDRTL